MLSREFGLELPKPMHHEVGLLVNEKADSESRELAADEIYETFKQEFLEKNDPMRLVSYQPQKLSGEGDEVTGKVIRKIKRRASVMQAAAKRRTEVSWKHQNPQEKKEMADAIHEREFSMFVQVTSLPKKHNNI